MCGAGSSEKYEVRPRTARKSETFKAIPVIHDASHPQSLKRVRQSPPFKDMTDHEAAKCLRGATSVGPDVKLSAQLALFYAMAVS